MNSNDRTKDVEDRSPERQPRMRVFLRALRIFMLSLASAVIIAAVYILVVKLPAEAKRTESNNQLEQRLELLQVQVDSLYHVMETIDNRVDRIYQLAFGVDPGNGGDEAGRYLEREQSRLEAGSSVDLTHLYSSVSLLRGKLSRNSQSFGVLLPLVEQRHRAFSSIPTISPVSNHPLTVLASGYGLRMHPLDHLIRMHEGIDFAAPEGTLVYATADGEVVAADTAFVGYGTMVIIYHGSGYHTRYAHLRGFIVKPGDRVMRGDVIAQVGSTGQSTAPHLHYEVLLLGVQINPIYYFLHEPMVESANTLRLTAVELPTLENRNKTTGVAVRGVFSTRRTPRVTGMAWAGGF